MALFYSLIMTKGGLVLEWHNDTAKEWGAPLSQAFIPLCIYYKPKTNTDGISGWGGK